MSWQILILLTTVCLCQVRSQGFLDKVKDWSNDAQESGSDFFQGLSKEFSNLFESDSSKLDSSSFGKTVQTGIDFFKSKKNDTIEVGTIIGEHMNKNVTKALIKALVPYLKSASDKAIEEYQQIGLNGLEKNIEDIEKDIDEWGKKYQLTKEINEFNAKIEKTKNEQEENSNKIVMNLPNVLNNLKSIQSNKKQTFIQMHNATVDYIQSLDETTREIVMVLFQSMLPPELKFAGCKSGILDSIFSKGIKSVEADDWKKKAQDFMGSFKGPRMNNNVSNDALVNDYEEESNDSNNNKKKNQNKNKKNQNKKKNQKKNKKNNGDEYDD